MLKRTINGDMVFSKKRKNLPPIKCMTSSNSSHLFVIDETGSVWGTGKNVGGQLGLGRAINTIDFPQFVRIEGLPNLNAPNASRKSKQAEKDIFQSLTHQQNKELRYKIMSSLSSTQINADDIKLKIVSGVIPLANWSIQQSSNLNRIEELKQPIQDIKSVLHTKQEDLQRLKQEVEGLQQELIAMEEENETLLFFGEFMDSVSQIQNQVRSGFEAKLKSRAYSEFSVDEVSLLLMLCDLEELVEFQREKSIDGELLVLAILDVSALGIENTLLKRKLEFYLKIVGAGLFLNEEVLGNSMIWRHRLFDKTLLILKEWEIHLDVDILRKKEISICQSILFNAEEFGEVFGIKMKNLKTIFSKFIK